MKSLIKNDYFRLALIFIAISIPYFILLSKFFSWDIFPRNDDTLYLLLAKGIAEGKGYFNFVPPPGGGILNLPSSYPLFLTPYWLLFHPNFILLKGAMALLVLLGVLFSYLWLNIMVHRMAAFLMTLAFACQFLLIMIGNSTWTETLFIPLLYGGLFCFFKGLEQEKRVSAIKRFPYLWTALILFELLARTRQVGIPFFIFILIYLFYNRKWLMVGIGISLFALQMMVEQRLLYDFSNTANTHVDYYLNRYPLFSEPTKAIIDFLSQCFVNIKAIIGTIYSNTIFPWFYNLYSMDKIKHLVIFAVVGTALWGIVCFCKKGRWKLLLTIALFISFLPLLPGLYSGTLYRYFTPFFPFLVLFFYLPFEKFYYQGKIKSYIPKLVLILLFVNQFINSYSKVRLSGYENEPENFLAMHEYVNESKLKPDLILSPQNYYTYLKTDCQSRFYRESRKTNEKVILQNNQIIWIIAEVKRKELILTQDWFKPLILEEPALIAKGNWTLHQVRIDSE